MDKFLFPFLACFEETAKSFKIGHSSIRILLAQGSAVLLANERWGSPHHREVLDDSLTLEGRPTCLLGEEKSFDWLVSSCELASHSTILMVKINMISRCVLVNC